MKKIAGIMLSLPKLMGGSGLEEMKFGYTIADYAVLLFVIIAIVSVFMIIYAGYTMMTSAGDPGKVKKGKDTLIGSIIGLVISLLAFAIVKFVVGSIM